MPLEMPKCSCGRDAVLVFVTEIWGPVGWCGESFDEQLGQEIELSSQAAQEDSPPHAQPPGR